MAETINLIIQYGIYPVMMAVLIIVFLCLSKKNAEKNNEENAQNNLQIMQLAVKEGMKDFGDSFKSELREIVEEVKKPAIHTVLDEECNHAINEYIDQQLSCIIRETKADRALFFSYHNGGTDILGRGFQKMSITNEQDNSWTSPVMGDFQNIPRTMFSILFKNLAKRNFYCIMDLNDIKEEDGASYQLFKSHNAKQIMCQALKTEAGLMVGFIVAEFITINCDDLNKVKEVLNRKSLRITGALLGHLGGQADGKRN